MQQGKIVKAASIAGFMLGEIYMLYTVLAPLRSGDVVPVVHTIKRVVIAAIFFGPLGALVGLGLGLLLVAIFFRSGGNDGSK